MNLISNVQKMPDMDVPVTPPIFPEELRIPLASERSKMFQEYVKHIFSSVYPVYDKPRLSFFSVFSPILPILLMVMGVGSSCKPLILTTYTQTHCHTPTSFTSRFPCWVVEEEPCDVDGGVGGRLRSFIVPVRMKEGPLRVAP